MHRIPDQPSGARDGIALVVVLGFLTVLVLMAVAFAIVMRTERMASRAYVDVIRARQSAQVGLARALQAVDAQLKAGGGIVYPAFTTPNYPDTLVSSGTRAEYALCDTHQARRYMPLSTFLGTIGQMATYLGRPAPPTYPSAYYQSITDPGSTNNRLIGQYAYLVVNCSGLLDANYIGGLPRTNGIHPNEIQISTNILPEFTSYGTNALPTRRRDEWVRFDSLPDLVTLCRSNSGNVLSTDSSLYFPQYPPVSAPPAVDCVSNLFVYSRAPRGWWDGSAINSNVVYVGSGFNRAAVQTALAVVDLAGANAKAVTDCLVDYTDADFRPQDVNNFSTEATPLINEILVEQQMMSPTQNVCRPKVELWYPFVGVTNPNNYTLNLGIIFTNANPAAYNPKNLGASGLGRYAVSVNVSGPWSAPRYVTLQAPTLPEASGGSSNAVVDLSNLKALVTAELREGGMNGPLVDRVVVQLDLGFAQTSIGPATGPLTGGSAVNDPRLNYVSNQWVRVGQGAAQASSLGQFNAGVALPAAGDGVQATNIFVPNRDLRSTGELGLLMAGDTPWRSIPLLGPGAWPVLDRFSVLTNEVYKGRVNLNSKHTNVLASVFYNARAEAWPGDPATTNVTVANAFALAAAVTNDGPYQSLSEIKNAAAFTNNYSALDAEGILRNSADLLTVRQQMFTIIVMGEAVDAYTNVVGRAKCVAVVWRDPFPNANGDHATFVRHFRWLGSLE